MYFNYLKKPIIKKKLNWNITMKFIIFLLFGLLGIDKELKANFFFVQKQIQLSVFISLNFCLS